jgi:alpha-tubulin suppressor-like RCC1 family protein
MEDVEEVAGGEVHCLALKKDGSLWTWGNQEYKVPDQKDPKIPQEIPKFALDEKIVGIGCGQNLSWAFTCTGQLYTWGRGESSKPNKRMYVRLPNVLVTGDQWEIIFKWLFLGMLDSNSAFPGLPVEVLFNVLCVWNRNFGGQRIFREQKKEGMERERS